MADGKTDETDTGGDKPDQPVENDKEDISELDKLKEHNDAYEKEIIRGRELKAEGLKQEAEKMVGGKADAGQESVKKETDADYAKRVQSGEFNGPKEE